MEIIEICIDELYNNSGLDTKGDKNGLEYAMYLRRVEKKKDPILFVSTNDLSTVLSYANSNIINAIGHSFMQLPRTDDAYQEAIKDLKPLEDIQLSDIIINYCGVRSALISSFHDFKNEISACIKSSNTDEAKAKEIKSIIDNYKSSLLINYPDNTGLITEFDRITNQFNEDDISSTSKLLVDDKSLAATIATEHEESIAPSVNYNWEILILDDNIQEVLDVVSEFEKRNIKVHKAKTVAEAQKIILNDVNNKITVAIADYRLFVDTSKKMQPQQGYDFLIWLSQQNRFTARVALSGLSKQFLMDSFRKYSANVKVYGKTDLVNEGLKLFVEDVIDLGEKENEVILNRPNGAMWEKDEIKYHKGKINTFSKNLKSYYIYHRNHKDYLKYEAEINEKAELVAREAEFNLANESEFTLETLVTYKGNSEKNLPAIFDNGYEIFRIKLLQRRVAYYLLYKYLDQYAIYSLLKTGTVEREILNKPGYKADKSLKDVYKNAINNVKRVGNFLAIQAQTDIPQNLLVEELDFLEKMGLPIRKVGAEMNQSYNFINDYLSTIIESDEELKTLLKGEKKSYIYEKNGVAHLCTLSLRDCGIVAEKIYKHFKVISNTQMAVKIKDDIIDLLYKIGEIIPATVSNPLELEKNLISLDGDGKNLAEKHFSRITDNFVARINKLA